MLYFFVLVFFVYTKIFFKCSNISDKEELSLLQEHPTLNFMKLKNYLPNQLIKCNQESTSYSKKIFLFFAVLFFTVASSYSQNIISVPFNSGFVGNNTANNAATNCYYTNSLGWSNLQFSQNSTTTIFVAQGNDIIGSVLITDSNGTKHTINGFVKWRTPSGNSPNTLVFSPSQSVT